MTQTQTQTQPQPQLRAMTRSEALVARQGDTVYVNGCGGHRPATIVSIKLGSVDGPHFRLSSGGGPTSYMLVMVEARS